MNLDLIRVHRTFLLILFSGLKNSGGSDSDVVIQRAATGIEIKKKLVGKLEAHYAERLALSLILQWLCIIFSIQITFTLHFSGETTGRKTTLGHNVGDWEEQLEDARPHLKVSIWTENHMSIF